MVARIAIIPARGGSKRIPKKNIAPFAGKPMLAWTIAAARDSGLFDRIVVSTDSEEIADVGRAHGADVPFLRDTAADDHAPVSEAVLAALAQAEDHWGQRYDTVAQLMPNCPLRTAADIAHAVQVFDAEDRQFQISVFRFGWMNPWWAMKVDDDGRPATMFEGAVKQRSQDLGSLFCPTGAIWLARRDPLAAAGTFYGPDHRVCEMAWESAVDIDDYEDMNMARAVAAMRAGDTGANDMKTDVTKTGDDAPC